MKLLLVINPASGTRSKLGLIPFIVNRLERSGFTVETRLTRGAGDATRYAAEAVGDGYDGVVACGGDGTVNEVATALCGTSTALGIIPTGSGNGLARHLEIPVDVSSSLKVIAERNIRACDYGTANGRPFFCTFGVGFDAAVSDRFARQKRRGLMMYLKSAVDEFVKYSPEEYVIESNGQVLTERAFLIVCCNASQYGNNAFIAPQASITDGLLDLTIVHSGNLLTRALLGVDLMTGFIGKNALIHTISTRSATIRRHHRGSVHLDGDPATMPETIEIDCHPGGIRIFSPTKSTRFRPLLTPSYLAMRDFFFAAGRLVGIAK